MKCNLERIRETIETLSKFNSTPENGVTRFSYSKEDRLAREYLIKEFKDLGLSVKTDAVGNVRARLIGKNKDLKSVVVGSHIDSVHNGGKFDGVVGVVGGLEMIRVFKENNYKPNNTVEVVIFAEEEGSNFNSTMLGSKCITRHVNVDYLKKLKNSSGKSSYEVMKEFGLSPDNLENDVYKKDEVKAMIELHIEQGIVLDMEKKSVGIVTHIAGMETLEIVVKGQSNHAGSTPMDLRSDALLRAANIITEINRIVNDSKSKTAVATVGSIEVYPNASNVIAGEAVIKIDIRDIYDDSINSIVSRIKEYIDYLSKGRGFAYSIRSIAKSESIELSKSIIDEIEEYAINNKINYRLSLSGAVHDAAQMASLTHVGMIFVPSINGKSHSKHEDTKYEDIKLGCDVLTGVVFNLTK